jgi:hypothetical protein
MTRVGSEKLKVSGKIVLMEASFKEVVKEHNKKPEIG